MDILCNLVSGYMGNMMKYNIIKEIVFGVMDVMNFVLN